MKKPVTVLVIAVVVLATACVAGCNFPTQSPTQSPTSSPTPTAFPTSTPGKLPIILRPESNGDVWLLTGAPILRGSDVRVFAELNSPSEEKNICGVVYYYIDGRAAGGERQVNSGASCEVIAGWLHLSPNDTMLLSAGVHTLKMEYLGNSSYAPSEFVAQFTVQ